MMRTVLLICTLILPGLGYAQSLDLPEVPTPSHIQIPGTAIFLVPPPAFEVSENFKGFQNPLDPTSMIMTLELPGPFPEISAGFTEESLSSQGMSLTYRKEVELYGFPGFVIALDQEANGMNFSKHILIFGDSSQTTLINGVFLADSLQLGIRILKSLESTFLDQSLAVDPRMSLDYSLDESETGLQFVHAVGNSMIFNRDGKIPTQDPAQVNFISDKSFQQLDIADPKSYCLSRLKQYPEGYALVEATEVKAVEIDGLAGYELYAQREDETEMAYQVILFPEEGGYFLFLGTYKPGESQVQAEEDLRSLVFSFRRK